MFSIPNITTIPKYKYYIPQKHYYHQPQSHTQSESHTQSPSLNNTPYKLDGTKAEDLNITIQLCSVKCLHFVFLYIYLKC